MSLSIAFQCDASFMYQCKTELQDRLKNLREQLSEKEALLAKINAPKKELNIIRSLYRDTMETRIQHITESVAECNRLIATWEATEDLQKTEPIAASIGNLKDLDQQLKAGTQTLEDYIAVLLTQDS